MVFLTSSSGISASDQKIFCNLRVFATRGEFKAVPISQHGLTGDPEPVSTEIDPGHVTFVLENLCVSASLR
jgi:hypothetical protein